MANKFFTALAALGLTLVIGGTLQSASAQQSKPSDKEKGGTGSIMDPNTGKRLKAAVDAIQIQAQHYAEAESALGELNMDHLLLTNAVELSSSMLLLRNYRVIIAPPESILSWQSPPAG